MRFGLAYSSGRNIKQLVKDCVQQLCVEDQISQLGFIFANDHLGHALDDVIHQLRQATGITHWCGCVGLTICAARQEFAQQPALAIMSTDLSSRDYCLLPKVSGKVSNEVLAWGASHGPVYGIVHADPSDKDCGAVLSNITSSMEHAFFCGGLVSAQKKYAHILNQAEVGGASGVLLAQHVPVLADHTQGCSPFGSRHRITAADRNVLLTLDGQPALDVLLSELTFTPDQDLQQLLPSIFVGLPIAASDLGDYMVRNLIAIDPRQRALVVGEFLEQHTEIMFCRRDLQTAATDLRQMAQRVKSRANGAAIKGVLYHSCVARDINQFGANSSELSILQNELGDVPLIGFLGNGEIYHNRLYAYTGVLTAFL